MPWQFYKILIVRAEKPVTEPPGGSEWAPLKVTAAMSKWGTEGRIGLQSMMRMIQHKPWRALVPDEAHPQLQVPPIHTFRCSMRVSWCRIMV